MKVTKYGVATIFDDHQVDRQWYPTKEKAYSRLKYGSSLKYIGTRDFELSCERCDKELNLGDNYIKCDEETRYCESCYEENSITYYTVGGEPVGDENDTEAYDDFDLEVEREEK